MLPKIEPLVTPVGYDRSGQPKRMLAEVAIVTTSLNTFADWADDEPGYGMGAVDRVARNTLRLANPDLKAEAEMLVEYMRMRANHPAKRKERKETRKHAERRLRESRDELRDQVDLITSQWQALDARVQELERDLASARNTIRYLAEERDELRTRLNGDSPLVRTVGLRAML